MAERIDALLSGQPQEDKSCYCASCEELAREVESKQAKIDALMLEYCPEEMTPEQMEEWAAHQAVYEDPRVFPIIKCCSMSESNGRVTWGVYLAKSEDEKPWDWLQVYSDSIEGRAQYEAARLRHFFGQCDKPDILAFDTDAPVVEDQRDKVIELCEKALRKAEHRSSCRGHIPMDGVCSCGIEEALTAIEQLKGKEKV